MSVDYDLVVIGSTPAGVEAAQMAARWRARVALVTQSADAPNRSMAALTYQRALAHVGQTLQQMQTAAPLGLPLPATEPTLHWPDTRRWLEAVATAQPSLETIAAQGIDVIPGPGEFCRRPQPGFLAGGRHLTARRYLIAPGTVPIVPDIDGLPAAGYLTPPVLPSQLPQSVVLIGGSPTAVELAQSLAQLGCQVTIVTQSAHLLPHEDGEAAQWMQAHLEAIGVRVRVQTPITQVRLIQGRHWIQAGNQAIEADGILLTAGQQPDLDGLNLSAMGLGWDASGLRVNRQLQTGHPRIYACQGVVNGYPMLHAARYEAAIAVKNALFWPLFQVQEARVPWVIGHTPQLARVGLTEQQALQQYGKDVVILRQAMNELPLAQIQSTTAGFCKLIVRRDGRLLGAHLVGAGVGDLIGTIALAMQQRLKVTALADLAYPAVTLAEIVGQTAATWQAHPLRHNQRQRDFLEGWFSLRRSWVSK